MSEVLMNQGFATALSELYQQLYQQIRRLGRKNIATSSFRESEACLE